MTQTITTAARRFLDSAAVAWDSLDPWQATAETGELSDTDRDALELICDETGEDLTDAAAEVVAACREKVSDE